MMRQIITVKQYYKTQCQHQISFLIPELPSSIFLKDAVRPFQHLPRNGIPRKVRYSTNQFCRYRGGLLYSEYRNGKSWKISYEYIERVIDKKKAAKKCPIFFLCNIPISFVTQICNSNGFIKVSCLVLQCSSTQRFYACVLDVDRFFLLLTMTNKVLMSFVKVVAV